MYILHSYLVINVKSCFLQMPGGGKICGDIHSINPELLVCYHGHTSRPVLFNYLQMCQMLLAYFTGRNLEFPGLGNPKKCIG